MTKHPAIQFRDDVSSHASEFLSQIVPPERVAEAAGRLGLAVRQVAANNPGIYECDRQSVAQAIAMSALTNLYPGGVKPDVYLIPRKTKFGKQLNWQISARGLQKLASRSGWIRLVANVVHREDEYEVTLGTEEKIVHKPCGLHPTSLDEVKGFYVFGQHKDGYTVATPVPLAVVEIRRRKAISDGIWSEWPIEMGQKTAVIYAISRGHFGSFDDHSDYSAVSKYELMQHEPAEPRQRIVTDGAALLESLPAIQEATNES
jgi:recombination protein RecT